MARHFKNLIIFFIHPGSIKLFDLTLWRTFNSNNLYEKIKSNFHLALNHQSFCKHGSREPIFWWLCYTSYQWVLYKYNVNSFTCNLKASPPHKPFLDDINSTPSIVYKLGGWTLKKKMLARIAVLGTPLCSLLNSIQIPSGIRDYITLCIYTT